MPKATVVNSYKEVIDTCIAGIPAKIGVAYYKRTPSWKGTPQTCNSDLDYYGYVDLDYDVLDRKGYYAAWLENKMTSDIRREIESKIMDLMECDYD